MQGKGGRWAGQGRQGDMAQQAGKKIESMMQSGRAGLAGTARQEGRRWEEKEVRQAARQGRMGTEVRQGRHAGRASQAVGCAK